MRLNALIAPTIQNTVQKQSRAGRMPLRSGIVWKPMLHQKNAPSATATCPASFTRGGRPNLSSSRPTPTSAPQSAIMRSSTAFEKSGETGFPVMRM